LHQVFAAFLRYQARVGGYLFMVTSQYPWGLLGDPEREPTGAPADGAASVGWRPAPPSPVHDPYWQVVLTARAKNLLVLVLVLGVASLAGLNIANAVSRYDRFQTEQQAGARVQSAYQTLSARVIGYESATRSCESLAEPLPCLTGAAQSVSEAFAVFARRLTGTAMPASAVAARGVVVADSARAERAFAELSVADSSGRYQLAIENSKLAPLLTRFDRGLRVTFPSHAVGRLVTVVSPVVHFAGPCPHPCGCRWTNLSAIPQVSGPGRADGSAGWDAREALGPHAA
jgi:hypothetical protein